MNSNTPQLLQSLPSLVLHETYEGSSHHQNEEDQQSSSPRSGIVYPHTKDTIMQSSKRVTSINNIIKRKLLRQSSSLSNSDQLTQCSSRRFLDDPFESSSSSQSSSHDLSENNEHHHNITSIFNSNDENHFHSPSASSSSPSNRFSANQNSRKKMSMTASDLKNSSHRSLSPSIMDISICGVLIDDVIESDEQESKQLSYKEILLLGERTQLILESAILDEEIDEIEECDSNSQLESKEFSNHRMKLTVNPIFHCNARRLTFKEDHCIDDAITDNNLEPISRNNKEISSDLSANSQDEE